MLIPSEHGISTLEKQVIQLLFVAPYLPFQSGLCFSALFHIFSILACPIQHKNPIQPQKYIGVGSFAEDFCACQN